MENPNIVQCQRSHRAFRPNPIVTFILGMIIGICLNATTSYAAEDGPRIIFDSRLGVNVIEVSEPPEAIKPEANVYQTIPISDAEYEELRWVLALEAQGEGLTGEIACCEAIFNRCISSNNWGQKSASGAVHGVLSMKKQFATYKVIGSRKAWAIPGELEDDAISECLRNGPSVLPSTSYVYFDSLGGVNGKGLIKIGNHTFGRE